MSLAQSSIHRLAALRPAVPYLLLCCMGLAIGCSVSVDKNKSGDDKNVKIETPLGGLHVSSDTTTAADVGLPVYPGATLASDHDNDKDNDKSADIHFGFGDWQFRLKVVKYHTSDSKDQVLTFYRKALGRYGDVIQCSGDSPVGSPTATSEGLTCDDSSKNNKSKVNIDADQSLKAGSKHHQHIMGVEKSSGSGTTFSLVELDLPSGSSDGKAESN
jgi:hypothetical protein